MIPYEPIDFASMDYSCTSKLWGLGEMLRFYADKFNSLMNVLDRIKESPIEQNGALNKFVIGWLDELDGILQDLGMTLSRVSIERLKKIAENGKESFPDQFSKTLEEANGRINDELKRTYLFSINSKLVEFYESETPLFGDGVHDSFPSAQYDISEAGKCFALGRSTATVMHLMRSLEPVLKAVADALSVPMTRDNWGFAIEEFEKAIQKMSRGADKDYYSGIATHFRFLKDAWRNYAMHTKVKYTEEEAEMIMLSVKNFMRQVSARIREIEEE